jgi:aminoglycoside phosphotransferase (APT) family kinase protein
MMTPPTLPPAPVETNSPAIDPELERIVRRTSPSAQVLRAVTLGSDDAIGVHQATAKAAGYGIPIQIDVEDSGQRRTFVLHGTSANQFGHDRRADRAAELLLAADTYGSIPGHARALDVGAFRRDGTSISLMDSGEFYLLTEYVQGKPYAHDLRRIAEAGVAGTTDFERARVMVDYLIQLHRPEPMRTAAYARSLRDLVGGGEGIFGIVDGYLAGADGALAARLERLERRCLDWRWRLKQHTPRPARIHGDFHPFNVLFDDKASLHVLDASRGSVGDAADDVSCMAVNFVFFSLEDSSAWQHAFRPLWREFWDRYLSHSQDQELLAVVAPFLAWRLLVLACPVWYPNLSADARARLLQFAESALAADRFDPNLAEAVFR